MTIYSKEQKEMQRDRNIKYIRTGGKDTQGGPNNKRPKLLTTEYDQEQERRQEQEGEQEHKQGQEQQGKRKNSNKKGKNKNRNKNRRTRGPSN